MSNKPSYGRKIAFAISRIDDEIQDNQITHFETDSDAFAEFVSRAHNYPYSICLSEKTPSGWKLVETHIFHEDSNCPLGLQN